MQVGHISRINNSKHNSRLSFGENKKEPINATEAPKITRREFLKEAAMVAAMATLSGNAARQEKRINTLNSSVEQNEKNTLKQISRLVKEAGASTVEIQHAEPSENPDIYSYITGSGVILKDKNQNLLILTNNHVIEGENVNIDPDTKKPFYTIKFYGPVDQNLAKAELVASDRDTDLAVLRLSPGQNIPESVRPIEKFRNIATEPITPGEAVVAIGAPLSLYDSVSFGVISHNDRRLMYPPNAHLLQTDAAINHGNSGGLLMDLQGRLTGINDAKIDDADNIGFSICTDTISDFFTNVGIKIPGLNAKPQNL